jgi:transketolase
MTANPAARTAYRDHLVQLVQQDPRVVCLDTDTGLFGGSDFGSGAARYLNLGIAEQNAVGVAAGLAASGWRPFLTTMAAFAASRAAEAVKIDVAYSALPVRIIGTHGGVAGGHLGPTHHCLEDLAVMRAMPNMTVVVPGDAAAAVALLRQADSSPGPAYVRLGRQATPALPDSAGQPVLGRLQPLRGGSDVLILAAGPLPVLRALAAAEELDPGGGSAAVLQAHTIKPFDVAGLLRHAAGTRLVVTVEEHWRCGGLGSLVCEVLARSARVPVMRLGFPDAFVSAVGTQEQLLDGAGLSVPAIVAAIRGALRAPGGAGAGRRPG